MSVEMVNCKNSLVSFAVYGCQTCFPGIMQETGSWCFCLWFSILLKFTGENFHPDAWALYMCTDRTQPNCTGAHFRKEAGRGSCASGSGSFLLHQGCQFMLIMWWFHMWDALGLLCLLVLFVVEKHLRPLCYSFCVAELYMHVIKAALIPQG